MENIMKIGLRPLAVFVRETEKFQTVDFALPNGRPETDILTVPGYILEVTLHKVK